MSLFYLLPCVVRKDKQLCTKHRVALGHLYDFWEESIQLFCLFCNMVEFWRWDMSAFSFNILTISPLSDIRTDYFLKNNFKFNESFFFFWQCRNILLEWRYLGHYQLWSGLTRVSHGSIKGTMYTAEDQVHVRQIPFLSHINVCII